MVGKHWIQPHGDPIRGEKKQFEERAPGPILWILPKREFRISKKSGLVYIYHDGLTLVFCVEILATSSIKHTTWSCSKTSWGLIPNGSFVGYLSTCSSNKLTKIPGFKLKRKSPLPYGCFLKWWYPPPFKETPISFGISFSETWVWCWPMLLVCHLPGNLFADS